MPVPGGVGPRVACTKSQSDPVLVQRDIAADDPGVAFRWKDYRIAGPDRWKTMRLPPHEFIRRFLLHIGLMRLGRKMFPIA